MNQPPPRQRLDVTVASAEFRTSKAGNMMAVVSADYAGENLTWFGMLTDQPTADGRTRGIKTVEALRALGMVDQDIAGIIGKRATMVCEDENDPMTGETRKRVLFLNPAPAAAAPQDIAAVFRSLGLDVGSAPAAGDEMPF